jgi:hypothetical protein
VRQAVDFAVPVDALNFEVTPDGVRHGKIEVRVIGYDPNGAPVNLVVQKSDVILNPKLYASFQKVGMQIHEDIDLPVNTAYLGTGIFDLRSGNAGTLNVPLEGGNPKAQR